MKLGLNEIMSVIDKVKGTGLTAFEYQDADIRLKIGNKAYGTGKITGSREAAPGGASFGTPYKAAWEGKNPGSLYGTGQDGVNPPMPYGAVQAQADPPTGYGTAQGGADAGGFSGADPAAGPSENGEGKGKTVFVESPMVGTFYAAASEQAEPFVKVGDVIRKGQTVGIVEAMKLMNEIEAECGGVVEEILVKNEQMVEYGQPLMRVRTEE